MRISLFCHLDDVTAALDMAELRERGLSGLIANVLYHDWACWAPMSRQAPLRREMGGVSAVPVRGNHPPALRPGERPGSLATLAAARDAGLAVDAWTLSLHRDDLARRSWSGPGGERDPSAARLVTTDAFGTRLSSWICPSSEEAAIYLEAHLQDIAAVGAFGRVVVEGCHYPMLQHGGAHERDLSRLGSALRRLLETCFCPACMKRMDSPDGDAEKWRSDVAAAATDVSRKVLDDDRLRAAESLRRYRISDLFITLSTSSELELICADQPAIAGYTFRTGQRSEADRREIHSSVGFDLAAIARTGVKILCLAYFRSPADVVEHVSSYLREGIPAETLMVALRPGYPDCAGVEDLVEKVRAVRALGVSELALYELTQFTAEEWQCALGAIEVAAAA